MPDKEGSDEKSTKSVVNKKQKQMMNTEEFSDRQRSDMKNLLTKNFGDESTAKNTAIKVKASRAREITGQSAVRDAQKYASGEYPKLGGGERMSLKMKGRGAATAGANPTKTGGPKENPKSLGGKSKGNTPVKVDVKKKPDMGKYFGKLGEEGYDHLRDQGRIRKTKDKKDATTMPPSKEMEKTRKVVKGPSALERVKKKYKGQIMKVEELDLTKVAEAFGGYIVEQPTEEEEKTKNRQRKKFSPDIPSTVRVGGQGDEKKNRKPTRTKQTSFDQRIQTGDPDYYRKQRAEFISKRDEYEIDKKGNITDRGVEKYARQMYRTNEPLTKDQLAKAREAAVGGTEVKDSKGNVVGKTTGKYGGRLAKQKSLLKQLTRKSPKPKVSLQEPETKSTTEPETQTAVGGEPPKPPIVGTGTSGDKPRKKPNPLEKAREFARKDPVASLAAYDLGKGILGKIMKARVPNVPTPRAIRVSAKS